MKPTQQKPTVPLTMASTSATTKKTVEVQKPKGNRARRATKEDEPK